MPKIPPDSEPQPGADSTQPALGRFSRRSFLSQLGAAGIVATAPPLLATAPAAAQETSAPPADTVPLTLRVNGEAHTLHIDPRTTLLDCLRENLDLPGTKKGCDHGQCGACTVHVNGRRVNSCLSLAVMHSADEITTIEGLGTAGQSPPHAGSLRPSTTATSAATAPPARLCPPSPCSRSPSAPATTT
jgi:xanthine dehydrogenase YagT iron-sulfur-binding subunit